MRRNMSRFQVSFSLAYSVGFTLVGIDVGNHIFFAPIGQAQAVFPGIGGRTPHGRLHFAGPGKAEDREPFDGGDKLTESECHSGHSLCARKVGRIVLVGL